MEVTNTAAAAERLGRVRAAQRGDAEAFVCLVGEHEAALRRFCERLVRDSAPAEDLAQETLLRAFQALPRLEDPARFGAWLFGIAVNLARLTWRRRHREPLSLDHPTGSAQPQPQGESPWGPAAPATPERAYEQAEQARRLLDAIASLPAPLRHTVILHYIEDLSYAEVAAAMQVPVTTVKGWLHKSRTRLRRTLADDVTAASTPAATPSRSSRALRRRDGSAHDGHHQRTRKENNAMAGTRQTGGTGAGVRPGGQATAPWWEGLGTVAPTLFGEGAVAAFRAAEEEARRWQHNYVGTEHLLLGVLRDPDGLPAKVLGGLGAQPDAVRQALEYRLGRGETPSRSPLGVVARARIALELAREDMRFLKHEQIAPEHVLLGLL